MVRSFIPEIPGWVGVAAILVGALVCVATAALPERWQDAGLYLGVGLAFASVGGTLVNLMMSARSKWRARATIVGSMLGALPLLFVAWHNMRAAPVTAALAVGSEAAVAMASMSAQPVPQVQSQTAPSAPAAPRQLEPVLGEISAILNKKARPALHNAVDTLQRGRVRELDAEAVRSQLSSTAQELEEVRTSLKEIQSRHDEFRTQLAAVIGDTAALDDLISNLRWLSDTLDNASQAETLAQPEYEPQKTTAPVGQWIAGCMQRVGDLTSRRATAS